MNENTRAASAGSEDAPVAQATGTHLPASGTEAPVSGAVAPVTGTVWSHTLVHLPFEDYDHGYRLVYVDLANGARVLAHMPPEAPAPRIGARVALRSLGNGRCTLEEDR